MNTLLYNLESNNFKPSNAQFNKHFSSYQLFADFDNISKVEVYKHMCELAQFLHENYLINYNLVRKNKTDMSISKSAINEEIRQKYLKSRNNFFPVEIQKYIKENTFYFVNQNVKIKEKIFNIELYYYSYRDYIKFKADLSKIISWLTYIAPLSKKECSVNTNIKIFFTPLMKLLPICQQDELEEKVILDAVNVNSAYTYTCKKNNEIIIYRKEEWFKVFLHETFHTFGMDFSNIVIDVYCDKMRSKIPLQSEFLLFESYCEFMATYFNIIYSIIDKPKFSINTHEEAINFIANILCKVHNQNRFSLFQMIKIMEYYNINLEDLLRNINRETFSNYKENSNVFAYYFAKSILMINFGEFYKWCLNNNQGFINFNSKSSNISKFYNFIIERWPRIVYNPSFQQVSKLFIYDKLRYNQTQDKSIYIAKNKKENKDMLPFILSTLRMTLY